MKPRIQLALVLGAVLIVFVLIALIRRQVESTMARGVLWVLAEIVFICTLVWLYRRRKYRAKPQQRNEDGEEKLQK